MTAGREEKQTASPLRQKAEGRRERTGWKQRPEEKEQPVERGGGGGHTRD